MLDLSIFKKMFTFFKRSFGFFLYIIIFIVIITVLTSLNATTPGKQTSYGTIAITASDSLRETKDFKDLVHYLKKYYTIAENITDINYALETAYIDGHITVPDNFLEGDNKIDVKINKVKKFKKILAKIQLLVYNYCYRRNHLH